MADITDLAHDRGSDGELLPVTEEIEIHGEEYEVEIYPATTGQKNEWRERLKDESQDLADELLYDLLDEFANREPVDFGGAVSWEGVRPAITDAMSEAILARVFDAEDPDEFTQALREAAQEAAAGNAETASAKTDEEETG